MDKTIIKAFLDKYGLKGNYSGGNDSGGIEDITTEIPCKEDDNLINEVEELIYKHILEEEFGSWSGNFNASGEINYDKKYSKIILDGTYTDEEDLIPIEVIHIKLTDFINKDNIEIIDSVNIMLSDYDSSNVRINIINGAWTDTLQESEDKIKDALDKIANKNNGYKFYIDESFKPDSVIDIQINELNEIEQYWEIDLKEEEVSV